MTRLLIKLLDYPDKIQNALLRYKNGHASRWDNLRLKIAKKIWETER